jgi:hypothetical protein
MYRMQVPPSQMDMESDLIDWIESVLNNCFRFDREDPFTYQKSKRLEGCLKSFLFN